LGENSGVGIVCRVFGGTCSASTSLGKVGFVERRVLG
jgi:hypothetical protein